jgi:DNA-binding NarL/FixJ family response regulator
LEDWKIGRLGQPLTLVLFSWDLKKIKKNYRDWVTSGRYIHKERKNYNAANIKPLLSMNTFTFKEKEVLALVSSGLSTKEIASKLNISHHTVETHRKNLLRKCEAKNSVELVQKAFMQQLIAV